MSDVYPPGEHVPFCMGPDGGGACTGYLALYTDWLRRIDRIEKLEAGRMGMSPLEQTVATNIKRLKDRIEALEAALKLSDEALDQMLIWMPSGFAPQSQANAMRLAYEARKVARAALAEEQDK